MQVLCTLTTSVFAFQRIRELEDRLDLQKRQVKEIEEKVHISVICFYLKDFLLWLLSLCEM